MRNRTELHHYSRWSKISNLNPRNGRKAYRTQSNWNKTVLNKSCYMKLEEWNCYLSVKWVALLPAVQILLVALPVTQTIEDTPWWTAKVCSNWTWHYSMLNSAGIQSLLCLALHYHKTKLPQVISDRVKEVANWQILHSGGLHFPAGSEVKAYGEM